MSKVPVISLSALLAICAAGCPRDPDPDNGSFGVGAECRADLIEQTAESDTSMYGVVAFSSAYEHPTGDPGALVDKMMKCYVGELLGADCEGIVLPDEPVPGCAVAIIHDFEIAYLAGYGKADIENDIDFGVGTLSGIGSAAKTITALAAMRMVEDGVLALGDPNDDNQEDDAPDSELGFTLYELLSHKSMLPWSPTWSQMTFPGTSCGGDNPLPGDTYEKASERLRCLLDQAYGLDVPDLDYHPGIHPRLMAYFIKDLPLHTLEQVEGCTPSGAYSNAGYVVAAAMIDRAAMQSMYAQDYDPDEIGHFPVAYPYNGYERYVLDKVLDVPESNGQGTNDRKVAPMRSACVMTKWRKPAVASMVAKDYGSYVPYEQDDSLGWGWEGPAGGWFMTIGDLARLALRVVPDDADDSVVSPATAAYMRTIHSRLESPACLRYGIGVSTVGHALADDIGDTHTEWFAAHDGAVAQYQAGYRIHPTAGHGVALMCNAPIVGSADAKFNELLELVRALQPTSNALP